MSEPFLAQIVMFGGNFAPRGWALCDGQLLPIAQYSAVFSLLGTIYGGDGRTTFALPDLRGRTPIHAGNGPGLSNRRLGSKGGAETTTLNILNMPSHNHNVGVTSQMVAEGRGGTLTDPTGNMLASGQQIFRANTPADDVNMDPAMISTNVTQQNQGGGRPFNNMPPYLTVNYIIALQGTFPSRS